MSSSVTLTILDSRNGTVLVNRWLGGNGVVERIREVIRATPDAAPELGEESWALQPRDLDALEPSFYADAPTRAELAHWASVYGADHFWWFVERNF